jgi:hypothetical protein
MVATSATLERIRRDARVLIDFVDAEGYGRWSYATLAADLRLLDALAAIERDSSDWQHVGVPVDDALALLAIAKTRICLLEAANAYISGWSAATARGKPRP